MRPFTNISCRKGFSTFLQQLYCSVLLTAFVAYLTWYWYLDIIHYQHPQRKDFRPKSDFVKQIPRIVPPDNGSQGIGRMKTILFWTNFFGRKDWYLDDTVFRNCSFRQCRFTSDKSALDWSSVVAMHPYDISYDRLPPARHPHQVWLLYTMEPPSYNGFSYFNSFKRYNGLFNWTMTLRQDSDSRLDFLGYKVTKKTKPLNSNETQEMQKKIKNIVSSKTKLLAAKISNCYSPLSNRIPYINRLRRLISLDFLGRCGDRVCPGFCEEMSSYKFFLSFENSRCRDYITEKLERPLQTWRSVPVVMGGAHRDDYKKLAPPHSYIYVDDFHSVYDLAQYLHYLDKNPDQYEEYFHWYYTFNNVKTSPWCALCEYLHDTSKPGQVYTDIDGWFSEDICDYRVDFYWIVTLTCPVGLFFVIFILVRKYTSTTRSFRIYLLTLTLPCIVYMPLEVYQRSQMRNIKFQH